MYKIYDNDQEYGPIEEQDLRGWICEGRVTGATLAFKEGLESWVPLSDFIEFADDFAALEIAATPAKAEPPKAAASKTAAKTAKTEPISTEAVPKKSSRAVVIGIIGLALCIGLAAGWFSQNLFTVEESPVSGVPVMKKAKKSGGPAKVSAEKSSYAEVAKHLDTHGQLFMYLSTEQLGAQADQLFESFAKMAEKSRPLGSTGPAAGPNPDIGLKILRQAYRESGLMDVSGVGLSSFAIDKGLYRNRLAAHHYPDKGDGKLWKVFGTVAHEQAALKLLPATTAFAYHTDLDPKLAWDWIKTLVQQSGDKALIEMFNQTTTNPQTGPMIEGLLGSVTEAGIAITLNSTSTNKISFPVDDKIMEFPEPGLVILLKVKDDKVAQAIEPLLTLGPINPQKIMAGTNELIAMMPLPLPVPLQVQVTMLKVDDYVIVCSTLALAKEIAAIKSGEAPGLIASEEFKKLSKGVNLDGNQFQFVSARMGQTIQQLQQSVAKDASPEITGIMGFLNDPKAPPFSHFGVTKVTVEGIQLDSLATTSGPQTLALQVGVVPAGIAAALILPAVSKSRDGAEVAKCQSNLKQAGLAVLIFQEGNQKMPTSWKDVAKELQSPELLVCPNDKSRQSAPNWLAFTPANATYELVPLVGKLTPASIVARCPIHNHTLHGDGSVKSAEPAEPRRLPPPPPTDVVAPPKKSL